MDIQKAFEEFVEKEWHDGHEPQGIDDQYVEEVVDEEEVEEASTYLDRKYEKKKKGLTPQSQKKKRWGSGGYGKGEEVEVDEGNTYLKGKAATGYELYHKDFSSAMQHAYKFAKSKGHVIDPKEIDDKVATGPKKPSSGKTNRYSLKAGRKKVEIQVANLDNKRYELNMYIEGVELDEVIMVRTQKVKDGFKWLVQKVEHNKTEILDSGVESSRAKADKAGKTARSKIKEETNIKENTMNLKETILQVVTGKSKLEEHCGVCDEQGIEEDSDPDKEGTQGDNKEWQKKRSAVLKKYGVASCALIKDEKTKKQCFNDLDAAHVADHEEDFKPKTKKASPPKASKSDASSDVGKIKDVSEAFWKVNIPDMPPIFVEASSASEIKKDMRTKLRPDVVKELSIERVSKSEMVKKYREMAKGGGDDEEEVKEEDGKTMHDKILKASQKVADDYNKAAKVKKEVKATGTSAKSHAGHCESTDSKMYSFVKKMMKR